MLSNASPDRHYDIVILERDISEGRKGLMRGLFSRFPHATLRFKNVGSLVDGYGLSTSNPHISVETYYRFLIQEVLPFYDKVLYLDSDLVVEGDVAELFDTELADAALAAVHDVDFAGNVGYRDGERRAYAEKTLGMSDPFDYFQAGVLLLNTAVLRRLHTIDEWLHLAEDSRLIYNDQDVLNSECEGRVVYLDASWNVMTNFAGRIDWVFSYAPASIFKEYLAARKDPKIVHFAGVEKPWNSIGADQSERYWRYARQTPFYEELMGRLAGAPVVARVSQPRAIGENNPLRKVFDPLLPFGSRRRELAKSVGVALSGKK